jgi:hypothetical protein
MQDNISIIFSKHYKRIEQDLKQITGFTPVMLKVLSFNIGKLEEDIINEVRMNGNQ